MLQQAEYQTTYDRRVDPWTDLVLSILRQLGARALAEQTGFKIRSIYDVLKRVSSLTRGAESCTKSGRSHMLAMRSKC